MIHQARKASICLAIGLMIGISTVADAQSAKPRKQERSQQPASVQQEPQKRQNFRARRADEFPPWEGFEDCPMAFPCVGMVNPYRGN